MSESHSLAKLTERFTMLASNAIAIDVVGYRSATPKYARESDILSGEGSRLNGGRWNPIGLAAVYASLSPETAMAETLAYYRYYGLPLPQAMPRLFVAVSFHLSAVLDLTDGEVRRRLKISEQAMLTCDWRKEVAAMRNPITQLIGQAAQAAGFEGLQVRSAADSDGLNLIAFPQNLRPASDIHLATS